MESVYGMVLIFAAAVIAAVLGFCGSALGMKKAGEAAAGAATERGDLFGKLLLLQALPGSQGIYGLVGAFLILSFAGVFGGEGAAAVSVATGVQYLLASLPLGIAGFLSAVLQGKVAAAGVSMVAKDPTSLGRAIVFAVMIETWAIFGFLISFILLISI